MKLFRPTGLEELKLIFDSGMKAFPPRLPEQPIFYPVLNKEYAVQIARDWNAKPSHPSRIGFVLEFQIEDEYISQFKRQVVGGQQHEELWIPAEELENFNQNIQGKVQVIDVYKGEGCDVEIDDKTLMPVGWVLSDRLYEGRHLRLCQTDRWEYVERRKASGIVAILAVTPEDKLLLVEQYRPPLGRNVIEIPAGLAGDIEGEEGEALVKAAKRELLEETGYEAEGWTFLTEGPASAGLSTEVISFYQASGLKKTAAGGGEETENITVHEVPVCDVEDWLDAKRGQGCVADYKIYTALYWYQQGARK